MAVDPKILEAVLAHVVATKRLRLKAAPRGRVGKVAAARRARMHQHRGFFAYRRADVIGSRDRSWVRDTLAQNRLKERVVGEYGALLDYLGARVGSAFAPGPVLAGEGDPPHLDLADVACIHVLETPTAFEDVLDDRGAGGDVKRRAWQYLTQRWERCHAIVWRAAAIHPDLWEPFVDELDVQLREAAMDEVLDRRLRVVERMSYQVSSHRAMGAIVRPGVGEIDLDMGTGDRPHGPWEDGLRVRIFEYPRLAATKVAIKAVGGRTGAGVTGNISPPGSPSYVGPEEWRLEFGETRMEWNVFPGHRAADGVDDAFRIPPGTPAEQAYDWELAPPAGTSASTVMQVLFTPSTDWWGRTWWYCDHVLAALQVEALRFGLRRRTGTDDEFNALVSGRPGYVRVGVTLSGDGAADLDLLMADDADPHFDNVEVAVRDLEVGDQLIFWNSILYTHVSSGAWQLENAVVTDVQSEPGPAGARDAGTMLQGHGTKPQSIARYSRILLNELRGDLPAVYAYIAREDGPGVTSLPWLGADRLVKWSPYPDTWSPSGPWWVRIDLDGMTVREALDQLPNAIAHDSSRGGDYVAPPVSGTVFFPLQVPQLKGGWSEYLRRRASGRIPRLSRRLRRTPITREMIPGLYSTPGVTRPFPVVRPRVTP
jgi:hypothetical protein